MAKPPVTGAPYYLLFYLIHIGCIFLVEGIQLYLVVHHDYTPLPSVVGLPLALVVSFLFMRYIIKKMRSKGLKVEYWKFLLVPAVISALAVTAVLFVTLYVLSILHKNLDDYLLFLEIMLGVVFVHLPLVFGICLSIIKDGLVKKNTKH